ncbi:MAG: cbb3-type cytochrome c oxidase subunit I [Candidatus Aenigmarchaeota archaeon]|nr:cbb3-type cytochrome c oxidase subunit I [Candidatus Aenigmarchaeota archaeon]
MTQKKSLLDYAKHWFTTVHHTEIGLLYLFFGFFSFIIGGLMALVMRAELYFPGENFVSAGTFNSMFTTHGATMVFLFLMPVFAGFGNYLVPLLIGAKDMYWPRVNNLAFWMIPPAALLIWFGMANIGWTGYAPLSVLEKGFGIDMWAMGLQILGISSMLGALNFVMTILRLRQPGMRLGNMPLFAWAILATSLLLIFSLPALTVGLLFLMFDRNLGTCFYKVTGLCATHPGDPVLWQHLFWFFGHPEVYVLILPAMGIISEVIPVMSRKKIFSYWSLVLGTMGICVLGFMVWGHHMFVTGLPLAQRAFYMLATAAIAVPTGIKMFTWIATMWGGKLNLKAPMLFAIGFLATFLFGGITGMYLGSIPLNIDLHGTYFVVGHLHYVLFGGAVMGAFAGVYFWFHKFTGRMYNEKLAVLHFWTTFIGFNVTFFVFHILGAQGMPRRVADYLPQYTGMNQIATIGAFLLGIGQVFFFHNMMKSAKKGEHAPENPWA